MAKATAVIPVYHPAQTAGTSFSNRGLFSLASSSNAVKKTSFVNGEHSPRVPNTLSLEKRMREVLRKGIVLNNKTLRSSLCWFSPLIAAMARTGLC